MAALQFVLNGKPETWDPESIASGVASGVASAAHAGASGGPATGKGPSLLRHLRGVACLSAAKNACGEGACGACTVLVDGKPTLACVTPLEKVAGKSVLTLEGLEPAERSLYARAFAEAGAVQCGFCTPA